MSKEISSQLPELDHGLAITSLDRSDPNSLRSLVERISSLADQVCEDHELTIVPEPAERVKRTEFFGNQIEQFSIDSPHSSLAVTARTKLKVTSGVIPSLDHVTIGWGRDYADVCPI